MQALRPIFVLVFILQTLPCLARPAGFYLQSLPKGKDVTLPRPAISIVPLNDRVTITATDMPQTMKLSTVNLNDGKPISFRVKIYDAHSDKVKQVTVTPAAPFLYSFKDIGSISLVAEAPTVKGAAISTYGLRLESDKPMGLAR
jgi:hypothetical protein